MQHIYLRRKLGKDKAQNLAVYLRYIATYCNFLKSLRVETVAFKEIWELIKDERLKRNLTRLQYVPVRHNPTHQNIQDYNDVVFSLQQSLRELIVYNDNVLLDESKAWPFPNVDTVFF